MNPERDMHGERGALEAAVALEQTLSLAEQADEEAAKFRRYIQDNHWADKARRLWSARNV